MCVCGFMLYVSLSFRTASSECGFVVLRARTALFIPGAVVYGGEFGERGGEGSDCFFDDALLLPSSVVGYRFCGST